MIPVIWGTVLSVMALGDAGSCNLSVQDDGAAKTTCSQLETSAWQKKIDALSLQGGGTLVVPKGVHLTGALFSVRV